MTYLRKITKLPRSMRVYFDDFAHEYKSISNEQKLLELANSLWLGVDLHLELKDFLANHQQVSECDVKRCLINYIGYLMTGSWAYCPYLGSSVKLDDMVNLFVHELMLRYRPAFDGKQSRVIISSGKSVDDLPSDFLPVQTSELDVPISEDEIFSANPWQVLHGDDMSNYSLVSADGGLFDTRNKWVLKMDEKIIDIFNERHKGKSAEIRLEVLPEPFSGNPLASKVIILSLNPGYVDHVNRLLALVLHGAPQTEKVVMAQKIRQLNLKAEALFCDSNISDGNSAMQISDREIDSMYGDWYWFNILESFRKEAGLRALAGHDDVIYSNVAVVQYLGYSSATYLDMPFGLILPSQRFTVMMLRYIALYKKDVVFVVSRSEKRWEKLIGCPVWNMLKAENRLVLRKRDVHGRAVRTQVFGKNSFADDGFKRIVDALSE